MSEPRQDYNGASQAEVDKQLAIYEDESHTEQERARACRWLILHRALPAHYLEAELAKEEAEREAEEAAPSMKPRQSQGVPSQRRRLKIYDGQPDYTLPHNLAAEVGCLVRMAASTKFLLYTAETLTREDFFLPGHQDLFDVLVGLHRVNKPRDRAHILAELAPEAQKGLGQELLTAIFNGCKNPDDGRGLVHLVGEDAALRRFILGQRRLEDDAVDRRASPGELASQARLLADALSAAGFAPGWEPPLLDGMLPAEPFPLDVLPEGLAKMAQFARDVMFVPPDYLLTPALAIAGGVIGRSMGIYLKEGWHEYPSLYAIIVGDPGTAKTPALKLVSRPVWQIFRELEEEHALVVEAWRQAKQAAEVERRAKGAKTPPVECDPPPAPRRIAVADTTVEALAMRLWENPRGLLMVHDELSSWLAAMNQYKGGVGNDKQFFLHTFSSSPIPVDRKGQESATMFIAEPLLSIAGGIQPDVLPTMDPGNGKRDGFIDRFLFSFPDEVQRDWSPLCIPPALRERWETAIRRLWDRPLAEDANGHEAPRFVRFSAEADRSFGHWYKEMCKEMQSPHFNSDFKGPWSKFLTYAPRLALVLDQLRWAYDASANDRLRPVSVEALQGAVRLIDYYKNHFRRIYITIRGAHSDNRLARDIVAWVVKTERRSIRESDVKDNFKRALEDLPPESLRQTFDWLVKRNVLRRSAPSVQRRGRPSQHIYEVNPLIFEKGEKRPDK
jgi:hypothetical protein